MDQSSLYSLKKNEGREEGKKKEGGRAGKGSKKGMEGKSKKRHLLMHVDKCIKWKGESIQL